MSISSTDRELLFGLAAASQNLFNADELIEATIVWDQGGRARRLRDVLVERGAMTDSQSAAIDSLLQDDPHATAGETVAGAAQSGLFAAVRDALARVGDGQTAESLDRLAHMATPSAELPSGEPSIDDAASRFEVEELLARGGLGEVYVARDRQLNRKVALKKIRERLQDRPDAHERFLLEAEITGRLEHPGVVPVYALGRQGDGPYFYAMRLIRGSTLEEEIADYYARWDERTSAERSLELRRLLRSFIDVCNAVEYAHSRGVVHRDLKPANIMLGKYGETLVVDWGLAKHVDAPEHRTAAAAESLLVPGSGSGSSVTQFGAAVGTPQYMSPEQAAGQLDRIGPASDVYSLGAVLYQLITGAAPFAKESVDRVLDKVVHGDFLAPGEVRGGVAKPQAAICMRAMENRVSDRYPSASALAQDVERWLADEPVEAYRESKFEALSRTLRRHQTMAASLAVAIVLLCLGAAVGSMLWHESQARAAEHQRQLAEHQRQLQREEQERFEERAARVEANHERGLAEMDAGRFAAAQEFFQQGVEACAGQPLLVEQQEALRRRAEQMARLVDFHRISDAAMNAMAFEEDEKAAAQFAQALGRLGVFEHADWWEHLPVEDVHPSEADRLEQRVHLELACLASLLSKLIVSPEDFSRRLLGLPLSSQAPETERTITVIRAAVELAQAYRPTEWLTRVEETDRFMTGEITGMPPAPDWQGEEFIDAFILGNMCFFASYDEESGVASQLVETFLGVDDAREAAFRFLVRATELDPSEPFGQARLGWLQQLDGDYQAARSSLGHAIALRPDLMLNYAARGYVFYRQAQDSADDPQRKRLLESALRDVNTARALASQSELVHWLRGIILRDLGRHAQAAAAILEAILREPPVDMVRRQQWQVMLQGRDPRRVRRLSYLLPDRFDDARRYAQERLQADPQAAAFRLVEAAAALALDDAEAAQIAVQPLLEADASEVLAPSLLSYAWAVQGEVNLALGASDVARDSFTRALHIRADNAMASDGLARTLVQLAERSGDATLARLAVNAYENLEVVAVTDWQFIRALEGRLRILLQQEEFAAASKVVDRLFEFDPGHDFRHLEKLAANSDALTAKLAALPFERRTVAAVASQQPIRRLPLRNGHFELGLNAYWDAWQTHAQCFAEVAAEKVPDNGQGTALRISHYSAQAKGSYGVLRQTFPALAGQSFRLTFRAMCEGATANGVRVAVVGGENEAVVLLPGETHDWREFTTEFTVPDLDAETSLPLVAVEIMSTAPGTYWVDDLRIIRSP